MDCRPQALLASTALALLASGFTASAHGADGAGPASGAAPASAVASQASQLEGAIGFVNRYGPAYAGSSDTLFETRLGGFVRWGRLTLSGRGGFVNRRADETSSGADFALVQSDRWRVNVSARVANGRLEGKTPQLRGMGDIDDTVRLRLGASLALSPTWTLRAAAATDAAGKGLGTLFEFGLSRQWVLSPTSRVMAGTSLTVGDAKHMQAWHGVSAEQSMRSSYAIYTPGFGAKELNTNVVWRQELGSEGGGLIGGRWALFAGASLGRLLGPAANSPLTFKTNTWQLGAGLAKRF